MGTTIDRRAYKQMKRSLAQALFILPNEKQLPDDAAVVNAGIALTDALSEIPDDERKDRLETFFEECLPADQDIVLCHIDVLFDPAWRLDVLRLLLSAGRNKRLYLVWPGLVSGSTLTYAKPGCKDYATYDTTTYVDTYVVTK